MDLFRPYADLHLAREELNLSVAMRACRLREFLDQAPALDADALSIFTEGLALADLVTAQRSLRMAFADDPRQMQCNLTRSCAAQMRSARSAPTMCA